MNELHSDTRFPKIKGGLKSCEGCATHQIINKMFIESQKKDIDENTLVDHLLLRTAMLIECCNDDYKEASEEAVEAFKGYIDQVAKEQ